MDLEKRILELLYFKDCVVIPGLGGFVSLYVPAKIREETQTFTPPGKEIGFNQDLVQDDGVLSGYLANYEKITVSAARILLDEFVDRLRVKLAAGERIHLTSIGYFSYAKTGELVFSASGEINFLTDSYGFSSFHFTRTEKEHPLLRSAIFKQRESGRIIHLPGTQGKPGQERTFRRVAMAIPLLVVISLLPLNFRHGLRQGQQPATLFPLPSLTIVDIPESASSVRPTEIQRESGQDPLSIEVSEKNKVLSSEQTPISRNSFAIIAGSFSSEKNASLLKKELVDKGFSPEIWQAENGFFRVVIQALENMAKAQEAIAKLREELTDIDFWVLK